MTHPPSWGNWLRIDIPLNDLALLGRAMVDKLSIGLVGVVSMQPIFLLNDGTLYEL
jgi:hypothetical protein